MKKLSMILAAVALVAVGCDPYEDAPGGSPEVISVTASGRLVPAILWDGPDAGGFFVVDDAIPEDTDEDGVLSDAEIAAAEDQGVPAGAGGNNVIVVTSNKLLDGATIQARAQDPSVDPTSSDALGDCRPAGGWLQITKAIGAGAAAPEPLTYDDPATPEATDDPATPVDESTLDDFQWYSCYYPAAATNRYGASIEIFRARVGTAPGVTTATRPLSIARLEANATYEFTGTVNDDSGTPLAIAVRVRTAP